MLDELEIYVMNSQDQKLLKWWAKYCESISDIETAKLYYHRASDHLSLVSIYRGKNNFFPLYITSHLLYINNLIVTIYSARFINNKFEVYHLWIIKNAAI